MPVLSAAAPAAVQRLGAAVDDLDQFLRLRGGADVVTAVAPHVPTGELRHLPTDVRRDEPRRALHGGDDGLDVLRQVVAAAGRLLRPGGRLLLALGGGQDAALATTSASSGFEPAEPWWDDDGDLRGLATRAAR